MMFRLKEVIRWFGVTVFEILMFSVALLLYSVLLTFKLSGFLTSWSWYTIHAPLFIADALIAYFCLIVFIRQYLERTYRVAIFRSLWSFNQIMLIFLHKLLLCLKLEGQKGISNSEIFSPLFALLILLVIRACQLL
jgi:hypothetical protein